MKKFIFGLSLVVALLSIHPVQAQKVLGDNTWIYSWTSASTNSDTIGTVPTLWQSDSISINKGDAYYYDFQVGLHEITSPFKATSVLKARKFSTDAWTTLTTSTYYGTGTDTVINYVSETNKSFYRYYKFTITRITGKGKPSFIYLSLHK
jgi:hypothetical protein